MSKILRQLSGAIFLVLIYYAWILKLARQPETVDLNVFCCMFEWVQWRSQFRCCDILFLTWKCSASWIAVLNPVKQEPQTTARKLITILHPATPLLIHGFCHDMLYCRLGGIRLLLLKYNIFNIWWNAEINICYQA
jgi:hypothetical protein